MNILFKYTTRSRRTNFLRGYDSIINNLNDNINYHILISVENLHHDEKMHPLPELKGNYKVLFRGIDQKGQSREISQMIQIN